MLSSTHIQVGYGSLLRISGICIHLDPDALHEGTLWEDRDPQIPSRFLSPEPLTPTLQGPRSMDQLKLLMLVSYCACETGCMTLSTLDARNSSSLRYSSKARRCWQPARRAHVAICGGFPKIRVRFWGVPIIRMVVLVYIGVPQFWESIISRAWA